MQALSEEMEAFKSELEQNITKEVEQKIKKVVQVFDNKLDVRRRQVAERKSALRRLDHMLQEQNLMLEGLIESRRRLHSPVRRKDYWDYYEDRKYDEE